MVVEAEADAARQGEGVSQVVTQYSVLYDSFRSRRLRPPSYKGLDLVSSRAGMAVRHFRTRAAYLLSQAEQTDLLASEFRNMSEGALDDAIVNSRDLFARNRQDEGGVRRALAAVREVARRLTGEQAYVVQLMGALGLYHGRIIEMLTGEGKTLTGSIAAPLIAWHYKRLHVFTVNDYLASRDAESRRYIYRRCLLDVGAITQEMQPAERALVYSRPIVYGTPKQIVADWLRDQIKLGRATTAWTARHLTSQVGSGGEGLTPIVPGLRAALVDEADAVLIDEGVVPLIIARSRREDDMAKVYREAASLAGKLDEGADFEIDHVRRRADMTRHGEDRLVVLFDQLLSHAGEPIWRATRRGEELVRQALVARYCYIHGQQYQIVDGKVLIVDEYTGRFLPDRQWEHGLHQAVEAKEGLEVTADRETLARLSFQRFFRSYPFLCGMTGTAADATSEMESVYTRPVTIVPTNKPVVRAQWPARVFRAVRDKWSAIAASIEDVHRAGRPVLVGTRSIAASELLARLLELRGLPHQILNANFDKEEADFISKAGMGGPDAAITVATNMAGRGTDIKPDARALEAGGLHVILTEMHGAKRIDRQFIGRAGRQGDPGSAQIFVSLEDELVQRHAPVLTRLLRERARDAELAQTRMAMRVFRLAQRRSEARDRRNRAGVLRQDDWIDKHLPGS
ncbi:Protein translocase subunit SecA [Phycisphaerales bacterium]|nr:Protein translocase subunit SecA [Phycisphaerales bacterium]